ncbi:hypothetical protein [Thiovibrio frasassiensis]|uniref:PilZ domain-containing protein n=1 Tax=Thiovibrio frasassiensis TaxID=2984131 RepID=A0A9X4RLH0_9BACT|nr:hypothetical protein [Thiovibrio frasassiensis]MDG4476106.1 hypothetical protein [Thiovibrio frasassiensis]
MDHQQWSDLGLPGLREDPDDVIVVCALYRTGGVLKKIGGTRMAENRESRRCRRFPVKGGVIALDSVYGEIIEMSFGGLSFRYTAYDDMTTEPAEFGIIFGGEKLFFENLPLTNVSDIVMDAEEGEGAGEVRRRGMAFGELVPEQVVTLARFIKEFSLKQ